MRDASIARSIWRRLEPIHAVTYFAPEVTTGLADAGYRGFWMGYFAARAAPLGPVGPELVAALFYNFARSRVERALPDAWDQAPPATALDVRRTGATAALRRAFGDAADGDGIATAAELAGRAARHAPVDGRPLFAANAALPWPDEPVGALWHASTLLREHRGDGHVATLTSVGLSGRQSNVFQAAAGNVPRSSLAVARDYDDAEWDELTGRLADRGLLTADGELTDEGRALKQHLEDTTDRIALSAYEMLDDDDVDQLREALTPLTRAVVATGEIPSATPMGATFDD